MQVKSSLNPMISHGAKASRLPNPTTENTFQAASQEDLVSLNSHVSNQDKYLNFDPIAKLIGGGLGGTVGAGAGLIAGTIAHYAAGAPAWGIGVAGAVGLIGGAATGALVMK